MQDAGEIEDSGPENTYVVDKTPCKAWGCRKLVKLAAAQTHRLWQAGIDSIVAMLGISALKRLTLGMRSADRKSAPDGSCCGN